MDIIRLLPDAIVTKILSYLTLRDAVRTSVVCLRWRYLWTLYPIEFVDLDSNHSSWVGVPTDLPWFIKMMDQIMAHHPGSDIPMFKLYFSQYRPQSRKVYSWIHFALERRSNTLDLNFVNWGTIDVPGAYSIIGRPDVKPQLYESLKDLRLACMSVDKEFVERFVANLPNLEALSLANFDWVSYVTLRCPKLKQLSMKFCKYLDSIIISSSSLLSFEFYGEDVEVDFKGVSLDDLEVLLGYKCCLSIMEGSRTSIHPSLQKLFNLKNLSLDIRGVTGMLHFVFDCVAFPRLRQLKLIVRAQEMRSFIYCLSLMNAAPMLDTIVVELCWSKDVYKRCGIVPDDMHPHQFLRVVKLIGFLGRTSDMKLARCFMMKLTALQELIIVPYSRSLSTFISLPALGSDEELTIRARNEARKLERELPYGAQLVIMDS